MHVSKHLSLIATTILTAAALSISVGLMSAHPAFAADESDSATVSPSQPAQTTADETTDPTQLFADHIYKDYGVRVPAYTVYGALTSAGVNADGSVRPYYSNGDGIYCDQYGAILGFYTPREGVTRPEYKSVLGGVQFRSKTENGIEYILYDGKWERLDTLETIHLGNGETFVRYDGQWVREDLLEEFKKQPTTAEIEAAAAADAKALSKARANLKKAKPVIKSVKSKTKKTALVYLKPLTKAQKKLVTGFQVQYSKNKKFTKNVKFGNLKKSAKSAKLKHLKSKKAVYVHVRAYKDVKLSNGKTQRVYGAWSKVKSVKVK